LFIYICGVGLPFNFITCLLIYLGMAIFDTMRHIRPDVSTVCVGLAARYNSALLSLSLFL
jgi:hypothetical protein